MNTTAQNTRFWSGAGLGLGLGAAAALWLGWQLSDSPTPSLVPRPPATSPGRARARVEPPPPRQPTAPPRERLASEGERVDAVPMVEHEQQSSPSSTVVDARAEKPEVGETPHPPRSTSLPAEPLRERFGSLSEALLTAKAQAPAIEPDDPDGRGASLEGRSPEGAWIDVWQPFVSPVSARGFADRLELLTGFTYRVQRRSGDGLHQVAVQPIAGYAPDQMLQQIADRSGLAMVSP